MRLCADNCFEQTTTPRKHPSCRDRSTRIRAGTVPKRTGRKQQKFMGAVSHLVKSFQSPNRRGCAKRLFPQKRPEVGRKGGRDQAHRAPTPAPCSARIDRSPASGMDVATVAACWLGFPAQDVTLSAACLADSLPLTVERVSCSNWRAGEDGKHPLATGVSGSLT